MAAGKTAGVARMLCAVDAGMAEAMTAERESGTGNGEATERRHGCCAEAHVFLATGKG